MRLPEHRDHSRHLMEGANMNLIPLGDIELHYTSLTSLDYGSGGQNYGTMEGWLRGESVSGELRLTNFAPRRPDNVNLPNAARAADHGGWRDHRRGDERDRYPA